MNNFIILNIFLARVRTLFPGAHCLSLKLFQVFGAKSSYARALSDANGFLSDAEETRPHVTPIVYLVKDNLFVNVKNVEKIFFLLDFSYELYYSYAKFSNQ